MDIGGDEVQKPPQRQSFSEQVPALETKLQRFQSNVYEQLSDAGITTEMITSFINYTQLKKALEAEKKDPSKAFEGKSIIMIAIEIKKQEQRLKLTELNFEGARQSFLSTFEPYSYLLNELKENRIAKQILEAYNQEQKRKRAPKLL